jgi:hypothetical protein
VSDLHLPVMAPGFGPRDGWLVTRLLGCWARSDSASPFSVPPRPGPRREEWPYQEACGKQPASTLGLCAHHEAAIFPRAVRRG